MQELNLLTLQPQSNTQSSEFKQIKQVGKINGKRKMNKNKKGERDLKRKKGRNNGKK